MNKEDILKSIEESIDRSHFNRVDNKDTRSLSEKKIILNLLKSDKLPGTVTYLNINKKFGFIISGNQDFYFNLKDVANRSRLGKNALVSFNTKYSKKGDIVATNITVEVDEKQVKTLEEKKYGKKQQSKNRILTIGDLRIKKSEIKRYMEGKYDTEIAIIPYQGRKIIVKFDYSFRRDMALLKLDDDMI